MAGKSDPYQVVARRFRPTRFDEVVGQEAVVECLQRALDAGQIPHAFMFSGSRGVGKTTLARILTRALNCEKGPTATPCDKCAVCTGILSGANTDVVEIDAASHNSVEDIRELRERVGLASMGSRYKVYLLDEVHMLSRSAFNAFLKTLEEPPPNVVFIMATTELHKVPDTIRSRCQVHLLKRVEEADVVRRLAAICEAEGVKIEPDVLEDVAASCRGGMRDAESMLERLLPVARESEGLDLAEYRRVAHRVGLDAVAELIGSLLQGDASAALRFAKELVDTGADEREALGEVLEICRAVLLLRIDGADSGLVSHGGQLRVNLAALADGVETHCLEAMIHAGLQGRERMRQVEDRRLVLELTLLAMARAGTLPQLAQLLDSVRTGAPIPAPQAAAAPSVATGAAPPSAVASTPAPAPAAPASPGSVHGRLMTYLEKNQPLLVRTLEQCTVTGPSDKGAVEVVPKTDRRLHRDRLAADGVQRILRDALREICGTNIVLTIGTPDAAPAVQPTDDQASGSDRKATPGPSVQKVVERFDGQIVDSDDAAP